MSERKMVFDKLLLFRQSRVFAVKAPLLLQERLLFGIESLAKLQARPRRWRSSHKVWEHDNVREGKTFMG